MVSQNALLLLDKAAFGADRAVDVIDDAVGATVYSGDGRTSVFPVSRLRSQLPSSLRSAAPSAPPQLSFSFVSDIGTAARVVVPSSITKYLEKNGAIG